ncbi:MAG: tRNA (N(6)-L-threonylcarbamoyladenosine(37)-C(2))-methylthiotransferase MtaB [Nitrospiria bacterium]
MTRFSTSETLISIQSVPTAPYTASFQALGCRLNQSESGSLAGGFAAEGFEVVSEERPSDISVINTCAVTAQAEAKCRSLIRRILKKNPGTFIAVTGCYAQTGIDTLRRIQGIDLIAGTDHKMTLPALLCEIAAQGPLRKQAIPLVFHSPQIKRKEFTIPNLSVFDRATRPNIKIQDGCDFFCTFCIIPYTRGRSRSRAFDDVFLEASIWAARGYREVVLTGVNLGEYRSEGKDLLALIRALETIKGLARIRISSIEPTTVSQDLIDWMNTSKKLCPFLHLPLQSGSDRTLLHMDRRYTRRDYIGFVREAAAKIPELGLGTDVMTGFPGEDEAAFEETLSLLQSLPFSYLHVFPYSRRKGTRVTRGDLPPVHPAAIKRRTKVLRALSDTMRERFYKRHIGQTVSVLFETRNEDGLFTGLTGNYIRVGINTPEDLSGLLRPVRIQSVSGGLALGECVA